MDLKRIGKVTMLVAVVLVLITAYLAIFFAPLPATSVRNAQTLLTSAEGSKITIVGFVTNLTFGPQVMPAVVGAAHYAKFSLADFSDYQRYVDAVSRNDTSGTWWTVPPIQVIGWSGERSKYPIVHVSGNVSNGANVSVLGTIERSTDSTADRLLALEVVVGPSGSFGTMTAPIAQKIFYFHMPSAWASYLAFGVALVASVAYLRTRNQRYDRWAFASVELGVVFATIAILTGPVWAKQEWGVYWRWNDTKLVTTFILWLVYIGYLSLRAAIPEPSAKSRISAVYGILGFVTVPMSFLSARIAPLLSSSHPEVIASSTGSLSPEAGMTIGIAVVAFTFLFITMLIKRVEIAESEEEIEELKRKIGGED